jgi:hypothetical protein
MFLGNRIIFSIIVSLWDRRFMGSHSYGRWKDRKESGWGDEREVDYLVLTLLTINHFWFTTNHLKLGQKNDIFWKACPMSENILKFRLS